MTTFHFVGAVAYDRLGSSWCTAAGLRSVSVTDPATGLLPTNLVQGGVPVSWLTADPNSRYSFECDIPNPVVDFGAGAEGLSAVEVPALAIAAGGATNTAIDARMKWSGPGTVYALGQQVISPNGDVVKANVAHTSAAAYATDVAKWTLSTTFGQLPAAAEKVVFVTVRGNDANDGKSLKSAFLTLGAAYTALGGPGRIQLGQGNITLAASLDVSLSNGVTIEGITGQTAGASPGTTITFTGTGAGAAINAQSSVGFTLRNVMLLYSSSSFTGRVLDLRGGIAGGDTTLALVEGCYLGSSGAIQTAGAQIDLNKAHTCKVIRSSIRNALVGIRGKGINTDYSVNNTIQSCYFRDASTAHISNPGDGWTITGCTWEPLIGGVAGAVVCDAGVLTTALSVVGGWAGDIVAAAGGIQFDLSGNSLYIMGTLIGGNTGSTGVKIRNNNGAGYVIAARFDSCATGIDLAGIAVPVGFNCTASTFTGVTTPLTAGYPVIQIDAIGAGSTPGIAIRNTGAGADGRATLSFEANKTTAQKYEFGIDPGGGTSKEWQLRDLTRNAYPLSITKTGSVIAGNRAALATTAVDGFLYIPTCAGPPTGVPTAQAGMVAMIFDTTNSKFYLYNGAWKGVVVT